MRKGKKDLLPGTLKATPAASRKAFKVEGLSTSTNKEVLEEEVRNKPRFHVVRHRLSGGKTDGDVIFGDVFVTFLRDTGDVSFSQPYHNIFQYGKVPETTNQVFWVFHTPGVLHDEPVKYVFEVNAESREDIPEDCTPVNFWLEEMDRAVLENSRRRSHKDKEDDKKVIPLHLSHQKATEALVPKHEEDSPSRITAMFAEPPSNLGMQIPPRVLEQDRFPCTWAEWRDHFGSLLKSEDDTVHVVLVPMEPGVMILNPCSLHASFLGELICIPWGKIKSFGARRGTMTFMALKTAGGETPFIFRTPRSFEIEALFKTFTAQYAANRLLLFPLQWPPLRYEKKE